MAQTRASARPSSHVTLLGVNRQVNPKLVEHKLHSCAISNTMPLALKHAASAGLTKTSKPIKPSRATSAQLDRTGTGVLDARSVQTRAASLDAALLRHASTEALPNTAEDLFAPILGSSKNLPGAQPHRQPGQCRAGW